MLDPEAFAAVHVVTHLLDTLQVPYVIGGSVASMAHGMIRTTLDVDLVADLAMEHVAHFVAALSDQFYVDEPSVRQAIERRGSFNLIHLPTMVKVDVFVPADRKWQESSLDSQSRNRCPQAAGVLLLADRFPHATAPDPAGSSAERLSPAP